MTDKGRGVADPCRAGSVGGRAGVTGMVLGRDREIATLIRTLDGRGPCVVHLHGVPGIGKSTLLRVVVEHFRAQGQVAAALDCRAIEPTEQGLRKALESVGISSRIPKGKPALVALDNYEHLQLLDSWIRDRFLPRQGEFRLLIASRRLPNPAWMASGVAFVSVPLGELGPQASVRVLQEGGLSRAAARRAYHFTWGHPMALRLAILATRQDWDEITDDRARQQVVAQLSRMFVADSDPAMRRALEAMSTVRRVTRPLLAAMLERSEANALYDSLQESCVVEGHLDGLCLRPPVQEAIAGHLRASDPARFTRYRRAAWRSLESQVADIGASELWRYTADIIYLIDNPIIREAFFPSGAAQLAVERARPEDREAILRIAAKHETASGHALLERWWKALPTAFQVVRDPGRRVVGFYCMVDPARAPTEAVAGDPMTRAWQEHMPRHLREPRRALFLRRWLAEETGEAPSAVQAACWLDIKRAYLESRPFLQRVYLAVQDPTRYESAAAELGFEPVSGDSGLGLSSVMLDFGPGSVDAWLRRLVRKELRLSDAMTVDGTTPEVVIRGQRIPLALLEHGVLSVLMKAEGATLARDKILDHVWGEKQYVVESNVLDAVVSSLRRKLGVHAAAISTIRGVGYRFRGFPDNLT